MFPQVQEQLLLYFSAKQNRQIPHKTAVLKNRTEKERTSGVDK